MKWVKRDDSLSVSEIIERNTGLLKDVFLSPEYSQITNMAEALQLINEAIRTRQKIYIIGDYDADGVTASAILYRLFTEGYRYPCNVRLPKRLSEGYGLGEKMVDEIKDTNTLLITVDNGIAAIKAVEKAKERGMKVLIIDHHLCVDSGILPAADIIVDPNAIAGGEFNGFCGAGLAYRLSCLSGKCSQELLNKLSALAAIGTVADVVPLIKDNRKIVIDGLSALNSGKIPSGLQILIDKLELEVIDEETIGFKIAPIINACGRLYDDGASYALALLALDDTRRFSPDLPKVLIDVNEKRKVMVDEAMHLARNIISEKKLYNDYPMIVVPDKPVETFHEGIIGIVAGKLAEDFCRPVLVATFHSKDKNILKGSGRSYGDFHLKHMLDDVSEYLCGYGGHAGAAGVQFEASKLEKLRDATKEYFKKNASECDTSAQYYDLEISSKDIESYLTEVKKYAPYGEHNEKIIFKISDYELLPRKNECYSIRNKMIKLFGKQNTAISFELAEKFVDEGLPTKLTLYGSLGTNTFAGKTETQINIIDFEKTKKEQAATSLASLLAQRMKSF